MQINIGSSLTNIKKIVLTCNYSDKECIINNNHHNYPDTFKTWFEEYYLYIQRIDTTTGWDHEHTGTIIEKKNSSDHIDIYIGNSLTNIKKILLTCNYSDKECIINNNHHNYPDTFKTWFEEYYLYIQRVDSTTGWGHEHTGTIVEKKNKQISEVDLHHTNNHLLHNGTKEDNVHFNYDDYILYFVHLTCSQDYNTGIQKVVRDLSYELNKKKKVILMKYNEVINHYEVINDNELQIFVKYGGVNHYNDGYNYEKLSSIYNKIKNERNMLIIPEILFPDQYKLFNAIFQTGKDRNYKVMHIYYDDTIYYHTELDKNNRELWFNEYITTISLADTIIPISYYSDKTYRYHKQRLNLNSIQNIIPIKLGIINTLDKICIKEYEEGNIIISNISKSEHKNYKNLIEAFKLLHNIKLNLKLIIFGHGWENKFDTDNNIEYKSFVSVEEKKYLFQNSLFSVYPSLREGYGIPIYESLIYGKPVICHNASSTLEIANDINQPCVFVIDCNDVNCIFKEMKKFCEKDYLIIAQKSIVNVKFKTNEEYGNEFYNSIFNLNTYFCEIVFDNPNYNHRGVGAFTHKIKKKCENITSIYNEKCHNVIFTHPPPLRNNKDIFEGKIFNLLKKISYTNHLKKIIILHDIIPHIFKDIYKPESDYYEYFEIIKNHFDIYICNSKSTKNDLYSYFGFNLDKMIVIYPELSNNFLKIDIENINIYEKYNITKKYIIAPLGADFRKNNDKTINSFIKWNNENYQLVLMYNCPETYKYELLANVPIEHHQNIIFTGYVPDNDYKYLIKNADFTLFLSLYEGFGYCVMESIYLGTPVLTSNISSTKELGDISPTEILLCDPNNINDIIDKMEYLSNNLDNYQCNHKIIFNRCYNINNDSLLNEISSKYIINNLDNIRVTPDIHPVYNRFLNYCKNKNNVKNFSINLNHDIYSLILNLVDINIQVRLSNGGGTSGCVTDSCFLNNYIITTQDLYTNVMSPNYENVILANINKQQDWNSIMSENDFRGYSETDINSIVEKIIKDIKNIKAYKPGVNNELSKRLLEYPVKLIKCLNLTNKSNICFITPYGNDNSGISDFSYTTIKELSCYFDNIDVYSDCEIIEMYKQPKNLNFYKIDEIHKNKNNYDHIIWVIGNSDFHNKMIIYGKNYGGTFLIHDETLFELYQWNKWVPKSLETIHPFKLREMKSIDYKYLCFHDILNNPDNKIIVHNDLLKNIIKNNYNINNIYVIEYPNFNFNIFNKLTANEIQYYKKKLDIDNNKLNLLLIGGVSDIKLPNYAFKILDKLIYSGIDTDLYLFYNK